MREKTRALIRKVREVGDKVNGAAHQKQKEERASRRRRYPRLQRGRTWRAEETPLDFDKEEVTGGVPSEVGVR